MSGEKKLNCSNTDEYSRDWHKSYSKYLKKVDPNFTKKSSNKKKKN
jgi:hypothetical protein